MPTETTTPDRGSAPVSSPEEDTMFVHLISGRSFTATPGDGRFGASSVDGHWDTGEAGTIFPGETLTDGSKVWA